MDEGREELEIHARHMQVMLARIAAELYMRNVGSVSLVISSFELVASS